MIIVKLKLFLIPPYSKSLNVLWEFCRLWGCGILYGGTRKRKAIISMDSVKFKKIFHTNPQIGKYPVPSGANHFLQSVEVKNIKIVDKSFKREKNGEK